MGSRQMFVFYFSFLENGGSSLKDGEEGLPLGGEGRGSNKAVWVSGFL